jgi:hypothetical protein
MRPFFLVLDEFQSYASRHVIEMLTRARKRGLGLTVAHQNLQQPPFDKDPSFLSTVLANTNIQVFFQLGRDDADRLVKHAFTALGTEVKRQKRHWLWGDQGEPKFYSVQEAYEYYVTELTNQERRECVIRIGDNQRTYFATTYDMPTAQGADVATLVAESFGVSKETIEAARRARIARFAPGRRDPDDL